MDTIELLKARRSINFFEIDKIIPENEIREIIEVANLSPSSFNLQPWELIVITDPEKKQKVREHAYGQAKAEEASVVFIVIAKPNGMEENVDRVFESWVKLGYMSEEEAANNKSFPNTLYGELNSERRRFFAVKNASFFAMNVMIAAKGLGYETHPMDGFNEDTLKEEFKIPKDRIVPLIIALGYKKEGFELLPRAFRRELDEFVKFNP